MKVVRILAIIFLILIHTVAVAIPAISTHRSSRNTNSPPSIQPIPISTDVCETAKALKAFCTATGERAKDCLYVKDTLEKCKRIEAGELDKSVFDKPKQKYLFSEAIDCFILFFIIPILFLGVCYLLRPRD